MNSYILHGRSQFGQQRPPRCRHRWHHWSGGRVGRHCAWAGHRYSQRTCGTEKDPVRYNQSINTFVLLPFVPHLKIYLIDLRRSRRCRSCAGTQHYPGAALSKEGGQHINYTPSLYLSASTKTFSLFWYLLSVKWRTGSNLCQNLNFQNNKWVT